KCRPPLPRTLGRSSAPPRLISIFETAISQHRTSHLHRIPKHILFVNTAVGGLLPRPHQLAFNDTVGQWRKGQRYFAPTEMADREFSGKRTRLRRARHPRWSCQLSVAREQLSVRENHTRRSEVHSSTSRKFDRIRLPKAKRHSNC